MDTILVIEDDHTVQKTMKRLFESEGYRVQICGDGESALDEFRAMAPTAVILDLGLPLISGKDVCREIRRETRSLPIIVVSALSDESEKVVLFALGANDYVTKPFSPRELLLRVKDATHRT